MYIYYVYILKCSNNSYYTGITNDLNRRLLEHKQGKNTHCYTYNLRPVKLVYHQEFNDVLQSIYFEKKIKKWTRAKKQALINNDFDMIQILSECRNSTHYKYKT